MSATNVAGASATNVAGASATDVRHSSPIFKFWKNGLFICSTDRVLIADLRNI